MAVEPIFKAKKHSLDLALWENTTKKGEKFISLSLQRSALINNEWKRFNSFPLSLWSDALALVAEAKAWLEINRPDAAREMETGIRANKD